MKIGIDISQVAYSHTGVSNFTANLVEQLINNDKENEYVLFFSSLRRKVPVEAFNFSTKSNVKIKTFKFPPTLLDLIWNKLHVFPIEWFIGSVDIFITSDWTEPPAQSAKKISILYDSIIYKYPEETHNTTEIRGLNVSSNIVAIQKRKHTWMKKEASKIICISNATKKDAIDLLNIEEEKLEVVYPGV